jgi:membrane fusion protein (multidrug efflux system)
MNRFFNLSFFLAVGFFSCEAETAPEQGLPLESFRKEVEATQVKVAQSEQRSFDYLINASGKVEARDQVNIIAERAGYLNELLVREGDVVEAGQIMARLDNTESGFQLEKAKARLRDARVQYNSEILSFPGIMEGEDTLQIATIEEQVRSSSGLIMAEIELKEAELDMEKSVIRAFISGKVADVAVKRGSLVSAGDEICKVLSSGQLELKVRVLESDIIFIALGQKAEIHPVSGGTGNITGTVMTINPKVDEHGLLQVTLRLSESGSLLPGMNARAVIHAPQSNSIVVPKQALVYRSGRAVVFTIENNESKWNYVEVGKDNGRVVEILDGVPENSMVIVTNNLQLAHQAPVRIIKE